MAWATTDDVNSLTGVTAGQDDIDQAQGIIEVATRLTESQVGTDDARLPWLRKAVAYQAAFIDRNPDLFGTIELQSERIGVDQTRRTRDGDPYASVLAPLAKQALVAGGMDPTDKAPPDPGYGFPPASEEPSDLTHETFRRRPTHLIIDGEEVAIR